MTERLYYYIELAITICGFDGGGGNKILGIVVISIASMLVIYSFYLGILHLFFTTEDDLFHVKYSVLDDDCVVSSEKDDPCAH